MNWNSIYKIKDSVDIYLVDNEFIKVYFMNTRVQKSYRISDELIALFEEIDGKKKTIEIYNVVKEKYSYINQNDFSSIFDTIIKSNILSEKTSDNLLSDDELKKYDRQLNFFSEFLNCELDAQKAQIKLKEAVVAIFGCGAIGGTIAIQLAMAGVENFILVDNDNVCESDIARHIYFNYKNIGSKKTETLGDALKEINNNNNIYISQTWVVPQANIKDIIKKATFVVNSADEPYLGYTAKLISEECVKQNRVHYIAGGFDAHLASTGELIIPYITPCANCYSTYFSEKLKDWVPEEHPVKIRYNEIGGLPSMSLFATSFACLEIIKYICGLVDMTKEYKPRGEFIFDSMELVYLDPPRDPNCKVCGGKDE